MAGFESVVVDVMVTVLLIAVSTGVVVVTWTTSVNVAVAPDAIVAVVAVTVPVPPDGGTTGVQPAGAANETNVVFAGMTSLSATVCASLGPAFAATIV